MPVVIKADYSQIQHYKAVGSPHNTDTMYDARVHVILPASPLGKLVEVIIKIVPAILMLAVGFTGVGLPVSYLIYKHVLDRPMFEKKRFLTPDQVRGLIGDEDYAKCFLKNVTNSKPIKIEKIPGDIPADTIREQKELELRQGMERTEYEQEMSRVDMGDVDIEIKPFSQEI